MFGMALANAIAHNPEAQARHKAYLEGLKADRAMLAALPRERLIKAIEERRVWTLPDYAEHKSTAEMIEAVAFCLRGKDRPAWLVALGYTDAS